MELWHLNIIAVLAIAAITRKDMAVIAGSIMVLGYIVTLGDYSQAAESLLFCGLNAHLAMLAAAYNHNKHCNLSITVSCMAAMASVANLYQMYDITALSSTVTSLIGWALVAALTLMDGSTGIVNGFMGDLRNSIRRIVYNLSHHNNSKGSH